MTPRPHQHQKSDEGFAKLKEYGLVYFSMQERTGKTLTSILTAEKFGSKNVLVITKKKALPDFKDTLNAYKPNFNWDATNYHQVHKLNKDKYDLVIVDEAHSYVSGFPDRGKMWEAVHEVTEGKAVIFLSATPHAQGYQLMFNQLALSSFSPWKNYSCPFEWFDDYGFPNSFEKTIFKPNGRSYKVEISTYNEVKDKKIEREISHLFISGTREELGFEHEPEDIVHYVPLTSETRELYNYAVSNCKIGFNNEEKDLSDKGAMRAFLHQLEGGVGKDYIDTLNVKRFLKKIDGKTFVFFKQGSKSNKKTIILTNRGEFVIQIGSKQTKSIIEADSIKIENVSNEEYGENVNYAKASLTIKKSPNPEETIVKNTQKEQFFMFFNCEKINFILEKFGDSPNVAIMYHFRAEKEKLEHFFKKATLLQGTTNAEGVDLSSFDHLVIYSQDYSTSKHTQRRARQANMERKTPINVHFLLVKGAVSDDVYEAVSINKSNFVDNRFQKKILR